MIDVAERSAALVGTRAASAYGEYVAGDLAVGLVERDVAVVGIAEKGSVAIALDLDAPGVEEIEHPKYPHHLIDGHPKYAFRKVRIPDANRFSEVGGGLSISKEWFLHERTMIAARCLGPLGIVQALVECTAVVLVLQLLEGGADIAGVVLTVTNALQRTGQIAHVGLQATGLLTEIAQQALGAAVRPCQLQFAAILLVHLRRAAQLFAQTGFLPLQLLGLLALLL